MLEIKGIAERRPLINTERKLILDSTEKADKFNALLFHFSQKSSSQVTSVFNSKDKGGVG